VTRVDVALTPERRTGALSVVARPASATIRIDDRTRGGAAVTLELEPGVHEIVIEAPAHQPRRLAIDLAKGESRRIDVALERRPTPLLESPWFWTGVGAVVIGTVVTTLALTVSRSPDEGSLGTFHVR
jgi:hypothetical protein